MPVAAQIVAPNLKQWKADGIKAANGMTSGQTVRQLNIAMEQRSHVVAKQQFSSRGGRGAHGIWQPLSPEYAAIKSKMFPGKSIMRRSDKLYNSLTADGPDNISRGTNQALGYSFTMGTRVKYALFHQKGGTKQKGKPPMRKLLDPNSQTLRGFALAIGRTIREGLFSRVFFEMKLTGGAERIPLKYTGFEQVDVP